MVPDSKSGVGKPTAGSNPALSATTLQARQSEAEPRGAGSSRSGRSPAKLDGVHVGPRSLGHASARGEVHPALSATTLQARQSEAEPRGAGSSRSGRSPAKLDGVHVGPRSLGHASARGEVHPALSATTLQARQSEAARTKPAERVRAFVTGVQRSWTESTDGHGAPAAKQQARSASRPLRHDAASSTELRRDARPRAVGPRGAAARPRHDVPSARSRGRRA